MKTAIQPVKKTNVSHEVFEQLKQMLLRGDIKPGEKFLSENELAEAFGVSRMTARQAVQKLAVLGLLETRLGEGSFVKKIQPGMAMNGIISAIYLSENSLLEVLEFRTVIEGKTAKIATHKATYKDIEELEEIWTRMQQSKDDKREFAQADMDFHIKLAMITKNSIFAETYHIINDTMKMAFEEIVSISGNTGGLYYHQLLLEAIKEGNGEKAEQIMTEHVEVTYKGMLEYEKNKKKMK
jgi:GntR family transcriptional repressor for pyruvate dehydrogenase complex